MTGAVKVKKKNGFEKLAGTFVPDDVDNVKSYIMQDIIVPAIKDVILDTVQAFLGVNGRSGDNRRPTASRISYKVEKTTGLPQIPRAIVPAMIMRIM